MVKSSRFNILTPWYFVDPFDSSGIRNEYQKETALDIIPFARRQDNDDIAGFKVIKGEIQKTVLTVHLTWTSKPERNGYLRTKESSDLFEWIKNIKLRDSEEWMTEDELADIIKGKR